MKTILLADDDPVGRELAREHLELEGYHVIEAADGQLALDLARAARPDLVLLDIRMPVLDGFDAIRGIRADPALGAIPVIAVTAFAMRGDAEKTLQAGFDGYVTKPIDFTLLLGKIGKLLADQPDAAGSNSVDARLK